MSTYEWTGAAPFNDTRNDRTIEPGETVVIADAVAANQPEFVRVEDTESDDGSPIDPSEYSVRDLTDVLESESYTESELDAIAEAEQQGDDRTTALDAIKAANE